MTSYAVVFVNVMQIQAGREQQAKGSFSEYLA